MDVNFALSLDNFIARNNQFKLFNDNDVKDYYYGIMQDNMNLSLPLLYDSLKNNFSLYSLNKLLRPDFENNFLKMSVNQWEEVLQYKLFADYIITFPFMNIDGIKGNYLISDLLIYKEGSNITVNGISKFKVHLSKYIYNNPTEFISYISRLSNKANDLSAYVELYIISTLLASMLTNMGDNDKYYMELKLIFNNLYSESLNRVPLLNNVCKLINDMDNGTELISHLSLFKLQSKNEFKLYFEKYNPTGNLEAIIKFLTLSI